MNNDIQNQPPIIDLGKIAKVLWAKRKLYYKVLPIVFILSCIWIFPQPRYYTCVVALAPEAQSDKLSGGGLSSLASSFGLNLDGAAGSDAIYPMLYPDLFDSPDFLVSLMNINVCTLDGSVNTDYYTYMMKHQKKNWLIYPFVKAKVWLSNQFESHGKVAGKVEQLNPFALSYNDFMLIDGIKGNINCAVDKKTNVVSITVTDQDARICATMADSIRVRLQNFIIAYRTSKARMDMEYYAALMKEAKDEYDAILKEYSDYCDSHQNVIMQASISERDRLENEMQIKLQKYTTLTTQYEAMKSKVQERTPAFTTLKSATIPVKPAGPKRMIFVAAMLFLGFFGTSIFVIVKNFNAIK